MAPQYDGEVIQYRPIRTSDKIAWDAGRPQMSIKDAFFPPTERLMRIEKIGKQVNITDSMPVIFGVRPCDARGMQMLDALFLDSAPVDPHYARRRQNTTIIGLACPEMGPSCFCTSVGGTPHDTSGLDILLTDVDGGIVLQTLTEKGQLLIQGLSLAAFYGELPKPVLNQLLTQVERDIWLTHFMDEYWERMSERCLSCRICAYVCPTCRCFAVRDEALSNPGQYERIRC